MNKYLFTFLTIPFISMSQTFVKDDFKSNAEINKTLNPSLANLSETVKLVVSNKYLIINADQARLKEYTIYNMLGVPVATGHEKTIAIKTFSKGVYIVELKFDKGRLCKKIVNN